MTTSSLFGTLAIIAFVLVWVFAVVAFVFTRRLMGRSHVRHGLDIGALPAALRQVRRREPLSDEKLTLAGEILRDRGDVRAFAIPATLFCLGCFYVFGSLEQLHGHPPSERTFLGVIPMLTSINLGIQMLKSARLKRRVTTPRRRGGRALLCSGRPPNSR
jgi:hypothetical protein